ncbi:cobyrinate a,c-diamide synthase [Polynucleobacter sp. 15G-AUS-farblos]|uniref:cobyrinate a,c-diamide synthase n=1 Tax=Polynucleobacter sp. 15G-AUS-farblos TaxID=2689094 RepID=UPI001C0D730F|nr:cobyrinate a,c-diamide synthase [Polynucleobacter sp. 15G-AUS-farblos]MBU3583319.1 cobyrinate a,c-diamide synthase [Polynucleobacter sp. 15G-AUS-farblos]
MYSTQVCPAILISAPASGQGKTTITCGIARLLARRGMKIRVFKYGPDFIDPYWLSIASSQPVYQLDMWMTGEDYCRNSLYTAAKESDLILIEGAMGLYDGEPSAAQLAIHFQIPVLTVIDASSMAGTFGALAHGLKTYQEELPWAGVLANRVASDGHAQMLKSAIRDIEDWNGAVFHKSDLEIPERHLGLVITNELEDGLQRVDAFADALEKTTLASMSIEDFKKWNVKFEKPDNDKLIKPLLSGKTIAIARDEAFCFIYEANLEALKKLGADLTFFSLLNDERAPKCDALWLPGGYPELHLDRLYTNISMRNSLGELIEQDTPIWAECGGMMCLFEQLISPDGVSHPMWGFLKGSILMQRKLGGLGAQFMEFEHGILRGHTFHYSVCDTDMPVSQYASKKMNSDTPGEALYQSGSIRASYFHAWFSSNYEATASLFLPKNKL